ncbi:hypothetical protein BGZ93_003887, partial [Podila epicladia]
MSSSTPSPPLHPLQQVRNLITSAMNPNLPRDEALNLVNESFQLLNQVDEGIRDLQNTLHDQATSLDSANATNAPAMAAAAVSSLGSASDALNTYGQVLASIENLLAQMTVQVPQAPHATMTSSHHPIPQPLSPKFTGVDADMTLAEFQAHLVTVVKCFPDALATDRSKIFYALSSMKGTAFNFFAPYLNGQVPDVAGILTDVTEFHKVLDQFYGNQNAVKESEVQLRRLQQTSSMSQYISVFQSLTAKIQWNEATFLSQFKEGLLNEVRLLMSGYWTSLKTMSETQTKATTAYQNLLAQRAIQNRAHASRNAQATSVPPQPLSGAYP